MKQLIIIIFLFFISQNIIAQTYMDQWEDTDLSYLDLINDGYKVKAYDMSNFNDKMGNMYMFFVTVLQKENSVYECQEYQTLNANMQTLDINFICRKLVQPYQKGLGT